MNGKALVVGGYFYVAGADGDYGGIAGAIGVDTVFARAQDGDGAVGSVDLPGFSIEEMAHAQAQTAGVHAGLDNVIAEIHELKIGAGVQPDGVLTDAQYRPGADVGIQIVAGGHWVIQRCIGPLIHTSRLERSRTGQIRDAGYAGGRIRILRRRYAGDSDKRGEGRYPQEEILHLTTFPDLATYEIDISPRRTWSASGENSPTGRGTSRASGGNHSKAVACIRLQPNFA